MRRESKWVVAAALTVGGVGVASWAKDEAAPETKAAPVAAPAAVKPDPKVAQLLADLGSDDYRAREKAGRDLAALGERALPGMKSVLLSTDSPEVQRRLAVLVRKMELDRLVAPKKVTLAIKQKTVKEALDEISKQTGYKIEYGGGGGGAELKHDFEFDSASFWVAIDTVAAANGCVVFAEYDDETIRVYNQDSVNPHVAYAGPFRFLATNIHSNKSVQLSNINRRGGNAQRQESMSLQFQIQSEPKNPMLGVTQAEIISAVDEHGGSLLPPKDPNNRQAYYENRGMKGHNTYGNLNLNRSGAGAATTIKSLKAKIGVILLSGVSPEIVVGDPLKTKKKTFTGRTAELEFTSFVEDPNTKGAYVLEATMRKMGAADDNNPDYGWANSAWSRIEVYDAAGNKYQTYGPNNVNNNGASVQFSIPFNTNDRRTGRALKLGPPVKVVVNEWLSVTHEVTFEFKDLPLP